MIDNADRPWYRVPIKFDILAYATETDKYTCTNTRTASHIQAHIYAQIQSHIHAHMHTYKHAYKPTCTRIGPTPTYMQPYATMGGKDWLIPS